MTISGLLYTKGMLRFQLMLKPKDVKKKAQPGSIRHAKLRFLYDVDPSATVGGDCGIPGHKK